jgi:polysaccharide export outer membrane protein
VNLLRNFFALILIALVFTSCKYFNQNRMLRTDSFYPYSILDTSNVLKNYKLNSGDIIQFSITPNRGATLISGVGRSNDQNGISAKVENDGFVKLPSVGRVYLKGLTFRQAELFLEEEYSKFINDPFVTLNFSNKRVFLFIGGTANVISLKYENTTLFEVLATSGGIPDNAKAYKIKIIRGDLKNPQVYIVDLSNLKGIQNTDLVMQGNDIIYIESRNNYISEGLNLLSPYFALLSTILLTVTLFKSLTN